MSGPGGPNLAELATELIEMISKNLSDLELCRLSSVNKRFNLICSSDGLWRTRFAQNWPHLYSSLYFTLIRDNVRYDNEPDSTWKSEVAARHVYGTNVNLWVMNMALEMDAYRKKNPGPSLLHYMNLIRSKISKLTERFRTFHEQNGHVFGKYFQVNALVNNFDDYDNKNGHVLISHRTWEVFASHDEMRPTMSQMKRWAYKTLGILKLDFKTDSRLISFVKRSGLKLMRQLTFRLDIIHYHDGFDIDRWTGYCNRIYFRNYSR